jgi:predicted TIM-barrel fold metal-dependent hydrolase
MVRDFSEDEKAAMFHDTAARVYRIDDGTEGKKQQ